MDVHSQPRLCSVSAAKNMNSGTSHCNNNTGATTIAAAGFLNHGGMLRYGHPSSIRPLLFQRQCALVDVTEGKGKDGAPPRVVAVVSPVGLSRNGGTDPSKFIATSVYNRETGLQMGYGIFGQTPGQNDQSKGIIDQQPRIHNGY